MLQNYFFLNRYILETKSLLVDAKIGEIFSQEKSKIIIGLTKAEKEFFLELCVIPGNSYLNLRNNFSRARKNTVDFFNGIIGETVTAIEIADNDRIIKIQCSNSELFFAIRGKHTNIFSFNRDGTSEAFKSTEHDQIEDIKKEFKRKDFIAGWKSFELADDETQIDEIRKIYPFIGREIAKEVKARLTFDSNISESDLLYEILDEIKNSKPCAFINEPEQDVQIAFDKFKSLSFTEKKIFNDIVEAVTYYISKAQYFSNKYSKLKLIRNHLEREMKKISNKLNNLQGVIERGSKEEEYSKYGNLLLSNRDAIKSRMSSIVLEDIFSSGEKIKINLNPALSAQKNVDYYFQKSRSENISFAKNQQLFEKAKKDFDQLRQINSSLNEIDLPKELDELMKKLKIKPQEESETKEDLGSKFKQYIIENKYKVYVGKDSKNNDLLTTRFAKQNDYWFHARGASGSHVIIKVENTKEAIPKNVLKKAAALAAYHSKAKTAGVVPVAFTFKKYVVKKKGDPVGTVHLLREDVLLVRPEIPDGCEFVSSQN